jgi:phosphohistidine phosphatase
MKTLTLLRHAKASRDDPSLEDFDRPLTETGRKDAALIGAFISASGLAPDGALCSPSRRTRETLELVAPHIDGDLPAQFPKQLYGASPAAILAEIGAAPMGASHLLVVGHNPGLRVLALNLIDFAKSDSATAMRLGEKFPPGALAHFELNISQWEDVAGARGALRRFATPKEIAGAKT